MDEQALTKLPSAELSWQWLELLSEQANAVVWTIDRDFRITSSRGVGLRAIGLTENELVGKTLYDYFQNRDESFLPFVMHRRALRGESVDYFLDWKGIVYSARLAPLRSDTGDIVGVAGVALDVTQRTRGERLLFASQQVLEAVAKGSALRDVLELLTRSFFEHSGEKPCAVMLVDPPGATLQIGASSGLDEPVVNMLNGLPVGLQSGSCGAAVETGEKVFVTNIATDSRWDMLRDVALRSGWRACWSVPLRTVDGSVMGTFAMYVAQPRGPTADEERLLERARDLAQIAIDRARSEASRRDWESRLSSVLENLSDCVWAVDHQYSLLAFNSAYADFCVRSHRPRPAPGMRLDDLYDPEQDFANHRFWRWIYGRALKGEAFDVPHKIDVRGQTVHWLLSVAPIRSENTFTGATVFARDVTDQKEQEQLLRWCADELSSKTGQEFFLDVVKHLVQVTGMDYAGVGSVLPGLPRRVQMIAAAAHGQIVDNVEYELEGTPCDDTLSRALCVIERGVQQAYPRDRLLIDWDIQGYIGVALRDRRNQLFGLMILLSKTPIIRSTLAIRALQTLSVRVAAELERQAAEEALRLSESLYHSLVENIPQHIFRKDTQGRFTFANQLFCDALHKPLTEILGRTDFDFFPKTLAQKYRADDLRVMQSNRKWETVEEHRRPDATATTRVQVVKTPLHDSQGNVIGVQGIFWDVT